MSFEMQSRVAELMQRIERNIEIASQNPQLVLESEFKGTSPSGRVIAWTDALGRVEHVKITPGSFREGDEEAITSDLNAAIANARKAAEELRPEGIGNEAPKPAKRPSTESWEDEDYWDDGGSVLR